MKKLSFLSLLLFFLVFKALGGEILTAEAVLAKPYEYESLKVMVRGKVEKPAKITLKRGGAPEIPFTVFDLKGEKDAALKGAVLGNFNPKVGSEIVLSGTFYSSLKLADVSYKNIVIEGLENCPFLKKFVQVASPAPPPAQQEIPPLTPEQLLTSPEMYDRKSIRIIGEVQNLQLNTQLGNLQINKFNLVGKTRVLIAGFTSTSAVNLIEGQEVLAGGVFYKEFKAESEILNNALEVLSLRESVPELAAPEKGKAQKTEAQKTESSSPTPPPPPPPPPSKPVLSSGLEVTSLGRISGIARIKVAGGEFPFLTLLLPSQIYLKVVALGQKDFFTGQWIKVLGTFYSTYPTEQGTFFDVISSPQVQILANLQEVKAVPLEKTLCLLSGKLAEKTQITLQGQKSFYLILETAEGFAYPVVSAEAQTLAAGDGLKVSGFYTASSQLGSAPLLKNLYRYPPDWKKGLTPEFFIQAFKLEKQQSSSPK